MCTAGCPAPGTHDSWGACLRAKGLQVQANIMRAGEFKAFDEDLQSYYDARCEGIQPKSPDKKAVSEARQFADKTGVGDPW